MGRALVSTGGGKENGARAELGDPEIRVSGLWTWGGSGVLDLAIRMCPLVSVCVIGLSPAMILGV